MYSTNRYREIVRARIQGAIAEARTAANLTHQGVKGTVLEILVSRLFRPLLPADIGIGTGQIIDSTGAISNEVDIVLYDRAIMPPALYDENTGLFPVEAVLYAIEVKTTLVTKELERAHKAAAKLRGFEYLPGLYAPNGVEQHHDIEHARSVIFALSSNGAADGESKRYRKIYSRLNHDPFIRAICVAGKEYTYDNSRTWVTQRCIEPYDEVLSFIGGVMNTYKSVARSRHQPLLGKYIIPEVPVVYGPSTRHSGQIEIVCDRCGTKLYFSPEIETMGTIVVNGAIHPAVPCSICGGTLLSLPGVYTFHLGKLISSKVLSAG